MLFKIHIHVDRVIQAVLFVLIKLDANCVTYPTFTIMLETVISVIAKIAVHVLINAQFKLFITKINVMEDALMVLIKGTIIYVLFVKTLVRNAHT